MKKTVILGASTNTTRYAYMAAERLNKAGHPIELVSIKNGELYDKKFLDLKSKPKIKDTHTVTLYIGTSNLGQWQEYILSLKPKRIIFNPGTEHDELRKVAENQGVETVYGCTLVMLQTGQY